MPVDHDEDFHFIATAYYLSPAVRSFWEKQYTGPILWFGSTLEVIADYLEKLVADRVAPQAVPTAGSRQPFATAGTRAPFGTVSPFPAKTVAAATTGSVPPMPAQPPRT